MPSLAGHTDRGHIQSVLWALGAIAFLYAIYACGSSPQSDFYSILAAAGAAFCAYIYLYLEKPPLYIVIAVGIVARIIVVPMFPSLSDDIYRFFWDGSLTAAGYNPYSYLPSTLMSAAESIPKLSPALFSSLNSPDYYTIYPPVSQFVFYLCSFWTEDIYAASIAMKSVFVLAEVFTLIGLIRLLRHLGKSSFLAALYWLNPLVIVEGVGNLHFEILMVSFLCWSLYYLFVKQRLHIAAILMGFSVAVKLLPLMLLPYFFFNMSARQRKLFFTSFTCVCLLLFVPIFTGLQIANFGASIDLYFQKFEFNGSIYYLLRSVGQVLSGYNLIHYLGPLLAISTITFILYRAIRSSRYAAPEAISFCLFAFVTYLLLATTVHPWYLITPLFLASMTRYRFVYFWSALILLTYINYSYTLYFENLWIVAIEYTSVLSILCWEVRNSKLAERRSTCSN